MRFCYVDETGTQGKDNVFVMVGVIINEKKLHKYSREIGLHIRELGEKYSRQNQTGFKEIKTHALLEGKGGWNKVDANTRKNFCSKVCRMAKSIPLDIVVSCIDFNEFSDFKEQNNPELPKFTERYWQLSAVQISLEVQSLNQGEKRNKGKTLLIFDHNEKESKKLSSFIFEPDEWIDGYLDKEKNKTLLNEIIDTAFTIQSEYSGLIQIADCYAYIIKRYLEIKFFKMRALWDNNEGGESAYIEGCIQHLREKIKCNKRVWGKKYKKNIPPIDLYRNLAPSGFIDFMRGEA